MSACLTRRSASVRSTLVPASSMTRCSSAISTAFFWSISSTSRLCCEAMRAFSSSSSAAMRARSTASRFRISAASSASVWAMTSVLVSCSEAMRAASTTFSWAMRAASTISRALISAASTARLRSISSWRTASSRAMRSVAIFPSWAMRALSIVCRAEFRPTPAPCCARSPGRGSPRRSICERRRCSCPGQCARLRSPRGKRSRPPPARGCARSPGCARSSRTRCARC